MTEDQIKAECRLYALEWATAALWASVITFTGGDHVELEAIRKQATEAMRSTTFKGLDPAMSDLYSAELEAALERILTMPRNLLSKSQG